jgi:flagellar basal body-associated protein FliL
MAEAAAPAKRSKKMFVLMIVVCICSAGGGFLAPRLLHSPAADAAGGKPEPKAKEVFIPFGDVNVNLAEGRLNRYLRVKIVLVSDTKHEKLVNERLESRKASFRNWLIAQLSDKTMQDVTGRASINRIRREILDYCSNTVFPEGGHPVHDVLFEEFMVQ